MRNLGLPSAPLLPLVEFATAAAGLTAVGRKLLPLQPFSTVIPFESAAITESLWVLMAASGCVYLTVCVSVNGCVQCNVFICLCERV